MGSSVECQDVWGRRAAPRGWMPCLALLGPLHGVEQASGGHRHRSVSRPSFTGSASPSRAWLCGQCPARDSGGHSSPGCASGHWAMGGAVYQQKRGNWVVPDAWLAEQGCCGGLGLKYRGWLEWVTCSPARRLETAISVFYYGLRGSREPGAV